MRGIAKSLHGAMDQAVTLPSMTGDKAPRQPPFDHKGFSGSDKSENIPLPLAGVQRAAVTLPVIGIADVERQVECAAGGFGDRLEGDTDQNDGLVSEACFPKVLAKIRVSHGQASAFLSSARHLSNG